MNSRRFSIRKGLALIDHYLFGTVADKVEQFKLTKLLIVFNSYLLFATLIGFYFQYTSLLEERADRKHSRVVAAWQLLLNKASGNSGKIEAIEFLNQNDVDLVGIDISPPKESKLGVYLLQVNLENAFLSRSNMTRVFLLGANLKNARLTQVIFQKANFSDANLTGAFLMESDLSGAWAGDANFTNVDFRETNLDGTYLDNAILYGAKNLTCEQLYKSKNWETAFRDNTHACGQPIPEMKQLTKASR